MSKKKMPPYGKAILEERFKHNELWLVTAYFSVKWHKGWVSEDGSIASFHVPSADYQPNLYDFSFLAGLSVQVNVDPQSEKLKQFSLELASVASRVLISHPAYKKTLKLQDLIDVDELPGDYLKRYKAFVDDWNSQTSPARPMV